MKFYTLEELVKGFEKKYRFRSLFNGCVGTWQTSPTNARNDAQKHKQLVLFLYDKTLKLNEPQESDNVNSKNS